MRVKQQAALSDTRPLRLPEPTAQPAGPVRSRSAPSPRLCPASRLCVGPRAPRGAAGSTSAAAEESARPCGAAVRAAAWLHAVGFGVRDFVAVVRKASFPCVVLATCTLSRGVPVVVCVFTPLRAAEGKRSPRPPPRLRTVFAPSTCFRNPPAACAPLSPAWPLSRVYWQVLCT